MSEGGGGEVGGGVKDNSERPETHKHLATVFVFDWLKKTARASSDRVGPQS